MSRPRLDGTGLKQYKDTDYYLSIDGKCYRKYKRGYVALKGYVTTSKGNKRTRIKVYGEKHDLNRMMWEAFKGDIPNGYNVVHKNGCSFANELGNLKLLKKGEINKTMLNERRQKIINLKNGCIYKGLRIAEKELGHSRITISKICNGYMPINLNLDLAWWDDVNGKAFKGNYKNHYNKYMKEDI